MRACTFMLNTRTTTSGRSMTSHPPRAFRISRHSGLHVIVTNRFGGPYSLWPLIANVSQHLSWKYASSDTEAGRNPQGTPTSAPVVTPAATAWSTVPASARRRRWVFRHAVSLSRVMMYSMSRINSWKSRPASGPLKWILVPAGRLCISSTA